MNKKILVISWFYPPVNSSEGLVTYKLLKQSKYHYDVFTQKNNELWCYDNKTELPLTDNVDTIFSNANNLKDWMKEAIDYYKRNKEKYSMVMTRSMPPESHIVGIKIKEISPEIKWIASFGDPISNSPYVEIADQYYRNYSIKKSKELRWIISPKRIIKNSIKGMLYIKNRYRNVKQEKKIQHKVLKKADVLIFNNEYQKKYMIQKKYEGKSYVIPHSFDSSLYPNEENKKDDKVKITYVGHLDDIRSPKFFLQAIKKLKDEDPNLNEKVTVEFYGSMGQMDKVYIIDEELTDIIKVRKSVTYRESLKIMQNSDWLLMVDADISEAVKYNIFFAAKLADYIGTGKQIIGITMPEGVTADILHNMNAIKTSHCIEEIKNYLWLIIYQKYYPDINRDYQIQYDCKNVAIKLDEILEKID